MAKKKTKTPDLSQKQLQAMLEEAQQNLDAQKKQLTSLEQTYAALTGKPSPITDKATSPSRLVVTDDDFIDLSRTKSRTPTQVPEGSTAANYAELAKSTLQRQAEALANPLLDPYYQRNPRTGLSPAQVEANKAVVNAAQGSGRPVLSQGFGSTPIVGGNVFTGNTTGGTTGGTVIPTGPSLARDTFKNTLALFFGATEAAKPWADALYGAVSKFYRNGSSVDDSFNLALLDARNNPELKPFTDRFKGIYALQDLKASGKPVLVPTIAEYVVSQAKMADVLNEANLGSIATDEFTTELISKGNSVSTVADKIAKAYQRIDMAPKAIKDTFSRYFPTVDRPTLAKTLLLGEKGVNELVDELEKYEVLAAAEQQGLGAINRAGGVTEERAKEYARTGGTFSSLLPKFGQIATALPTTTKLSQISKVEDVGQVGLEKAIISQSAKELEKLQQLTEQEEARFRAKSGRAELGLASQRRANRAF